MEMVVVDLVAEEGETEVMAAEEVTAGGAEVEGLTVEGAAVVVMSLPRPRRRCRTDRIAWSSHPRIQCIDRRWTTMLSKSIFQNQRQMKGCNSPSRVPWTCSP